MRARFTSQPRPSIGMLGFALLAANASCSGGSDSGGETGGLVDTPASGGGDGTATGGAASWNSAGGDAALGGATTGGTSSIAPPSGGSTTGGSASGGASSGGSTAGGSASGGTGTGGRATGGSPSGGSATGGTATGGTATGGTATGGANAGGSATGGATTTSGLPWLHVNGNQIQDPHGNEVILRGISTVDLGALDAWYGGAFAMIDRLTNAADSSGSSPGWATKVIRLAVYPYDSPDVDSPNTWQPGTDTFYDGLLRPVVDYCASKGLYAIIDWHYIDSTSSHRDTTSGFWSYIAAKFSTDSNVLFELYNEPINDGDWASVRSDMQTWYDTVRASAPDNLVLVGTPNWCQVIGPTATSPIDGTNVVYTAHMYPMHWASPSLRQEIVTAVASHPVFLTEWGFEQNSDAVVDGTISSYATPFKEFVETNRLSWTAWVASYDWFPAMFDPGWVLAVGEGRMGGFTKDWLYERRSDNQPQP